MGPLPCNAAINSLEEALAVNKHLVQQVSADRDMTTSAATEALISLERDRVELLRGLRVIRTYGLAPMALVRRVAA